MSRKPKYKHPTLPANRNSYEKYFEYEWTKRDLGRVYTYTVLTKRGNSWIWKQIGEGQGLSLQDKRNFFTDALYVLVKNKKTKLPVYGMYIEKSFWYGSTKERINQDYIQSIANLHLGKLEDAIIEVKKV